MLTTDNRDMQDVEAYLHARIEALKRRISELEAERTCTCTRAREESCLTERDTIVG